MAIPCWTEVNIFAAVERRKKEVKIMGRYTVLGLRESTLGGGEKRMNEEREKRVVYCHLRRLRGKYAAS